MRLYRGAWICFFAASLSLRAQTPTFTFEGYGDSTALTTQYSGFTFSNTIILGAGITLNELEFPPHSGSNNVASDNGGPITIAFASPQRGFLGYFTYSAQVTIQALGASNNVLASAQSLFSNNEARSGAAQSKPNELLHVASPADIYKILITGSPQGTSFTLDDAVVISRCDLDSNGIVDPADVQIVMNEALGAAQPVDDLNGDGVVNVVDAQIVINGAILFGCAGR
jgi:hypothetical protein